MRTVRIDRGAARDRTRPPTYAMVPASGEPPVGVWAFDSLTPHDTRVGEHAHEFPVLVYFERARGSLTVGGRNWSLAPGAVFVVAPGETVGPFDTSDVHEAAGWTVSFTPDALGPDSPGLAWRTHPMLFPFARGGAVGALRYTVPEPDRREWTDRLRTLHDELTGRPDGYREAVLAHLVLALPFSIISISNALEGFDKSIEDAAILARCLEGIEREGITAALARYVAARRERTAQVQLTSRQNRWGKGATDVDWVYGYNAWTAPLVPA